MLDLVNRANLTGHQLQLISSQVREHRTLGEVLGWVLGRIPARDRVGFIPQVVVQDEYSHDVIVPWDDRLVLVYGTS